MTEPNAQKKNLKSSSTELGLIDSHAHLDYEYEMGLAQVLANAKDAGVSHIIAIAAEPDSIDRVFDLAKKHNNLFHTAGVHPHEAKFWNKDLFAKVKERSLSPKCVAIGELGLDYYYDHSDRDEQIACLRDQLEYSVAVGKPIVVHTRDAETDTISELTKHSHSWRASHGTELSPGVIHCFTASREFADFALKAGYYISFSGIVTFKNAEDLRAVVKIVPLDRLLVETDSPYLAPIPHRGKQNQPAYVRFVAEKLAELKDVSIAELIALTRANTIKLFGLPLKS